MSCNKKSDGLFAKSTKATSTDFSRNITRSREQFSESGTSADEDVTFQFHNQDSVVAMNGKNHADLVGCSGRTRKRPILRQPSIKRRKNQRQAIVEKQLRRLKKTRYRQFCSSERKKKPLDLFESLAESSQSRVPERREKRIRSSQAACSSRSSGEQIEEQRHRSRSDAGPPANDKFRFWNNKPKTEAPVVLKRCFPKTGTMQLKQIIPSSGSKEKYIEIKIDDNDELRQSLINRCEETVLDIVEQLCAGQLPRISYKISTIDTLMDGLVSQNSDSVSTVSIDTNPTSRAGIETSSVFETPESMDTESIEMKSEESFQESLGQRRRVDFGFKRSRRNFALMMITMAKVHELLCNNRTETRRSFYYELKSDENASRIVTKQRQVDEVIVILSNVLECPPWGMGLVPSARGLAAGNMTLISNDNKIHFTNPGGTLISQIVFNLKGIRTKAKFVIVVEKEAVFQKLMDEDCPNRLDCILITGKGFPDIATRILVKKLAEMMELTVYVLVDADPYGFDIMCNYKYGSINLSHAQGRLACTSIRWLGLHPSELTSLLKIPTIPLADADISKLEFLLTRPYVNERLSKELTIMRKGKAEIEAIIGSSSSYSYSNYLRMKINDGDYI